MTVPTITASSRGLARWRGGHPWIYRSDVEPSSAPAGVVAVTDRRGRVHGQALWSPTSEIRLRLLTTDDAQIDTSWWITQLRAAAARRQSLVPRATAFREVFGEADGLPSLIVDRYGAFVVAQLLSAGLESVRDQILAAIEEVYRPEAVLLRNDAAVRRHEHLPLVIEPVVGTVPALVEVQEAAVPYFVAPHAGQKTGGFLDQRENRTGVGRLARGRALDAFCYQGLFALHMTRTADEVVGIDSSADALHMAERNRTRNDAANVRWIEGNAFDVLRQFDERGERFDTIVLDPPAFAKRRDALPTALRGYGEINRRALRVLAPGGRLFTASCSFHLTRPVFLEMLARAAADSERHIVLETLLGQASDHPEVLTIPETGYLKAAILRADL